MTVAGGPRASAIVASWNAGDVLPACLDGILGQELPGGLEVLVVNDGSTDDTAEVLRRYEDRVRVITNERNAGFSASNNRAAGEAHGRMLFFLNSDLELPQRDALARLAQVAEDPMVGIAGPGLLNPDGSVQPSCSAHPSVGRALAIASGVARLLPDRLRARVAPHMWSHDHATDTGWVLGAALAMREDVFRELGGFWPQMYGEEQDLAWRAERRGLRVRFEPSARMVHIGNHSLAKRWTEPERAARVARAELAFLRNHYPAARAALIRAITAAGFAARALAHGMAGRRERAVVFRAMARVYVTDGAGRAG